MFFLYPKYLRCSLHFLRCSKLAVLSELLNYFPLFIGVSGFLILFFLMAYVVAALIRSYCSGVIGDLAVYALIASFILSKTVLAGRSVGIR